MLALLLLLVSFSSAFALDKACPFKPTDMIFVLDGSGSEGEDNFKKQLNFVSNFTNQFEIGQNKTRVSLVTFATTVNNEFYLNRYYDNTTLLRAIGQAHYPNGETNTHLALDHVRLQSLLPSNGAERNVSKIVFVLTDGRSLEEEATKSAAMQLKKDPRVTVVAIGIGNAVDDNELRAIASDANHTIRVATFDALNSIKVELTQKTCDTCNDLSDVCFILDSSGSEGSGNFHQQLEFVKMVVNEFSIEGSSKTRICVVTFSTTSLGEIHLNSFNDKTALLQNIMKIPYRDGETMTNLGINHGFSELTNPPRQGANKVMILLTDGRSTEPDLTRQSASAVQRAGVDVFAIGIGPNVDSQELRFIATAPDHVFEVDRFHDLASIHQEVVNKICAKALITTTTTTTSTTTTRPTTTTTKPTTTTTKTTTKLTTTLPPTTTRAACGLKPADIVFVLDSSDSEGAENFKKQVDFVYNFAAQFSIGVNSVQFSVVTYSTDVQNIFYFNDHLTRQEVLQAIRNNITYLGQGTNTSGALQQVRENNLQTKHGARPNAQNFVIVITDGRSDDTNATRSEAHELQKIAQVLSVGIGPRVDSSELAAIASNHKVLTVDTFELLQTFKQQLTDLACQSGR
ncbi:collagen alpha-1(XIV) chain-like isoform X2 [Dreissena polymorpha]|uniref:collagen alpha-1(XIV) chain-like isoform X2 n=1 Tax=Dreissena polymorpha TaxID=45954 RepID=UPI002264C413|nr:collagen alpha-1(XIV) chain-like isoform X2 [Dreissena polymorpha]